MPILISYLKSVNTKCHLHLITIALDYYKWEIKDLDAYTFIELYLTIIEWKEILQYR